MVRKYPEFGYDSEPTQAQVNDAATREYGIFVPAGETVKARRDRIAEGFAFAFAMKFGFFNEGGAANAIAAANALIEELDRA